MTKPSPLLLLAISLALVPGCGDAERDDDDDRALVEQLRRGGQVLVLRHAATDSATDMTGDLSDCSRQRNLRAQGRRQARAIGRAIRRLQIPVGRVLASPFCRTRDTARLAFGHVRPSRALLSAELLEGQDAGRGEPQGLRRLLVRPRPGTNTVLVSHESAIDAATGVNVDEGEALVVSPRAGRKSFAVVARLTPRDFARLR
jgi:phosphohistidine phosphatase SixA